MRPRMYLLAKAVSFLTKGKMMVGYPRMLEEIMSSYPLEERLNGKEGVDIGCDWGNSLVYWRLNGASRVIAYERDPDRKRLMGPLLKEPWVDFRGAWDGELPDADFFKIDCEGCESQLDVSALKKYRLWFVALHGPTMGMGPKLEELGGRIVHDKPGGIGERVYSNVKSLKR